MAVRQQQSFRCHRYYLGMGEAANRIKPAAFQMPLRSQVFFLVSHFLIESQLRKIFPVSCVQKKPLHTLQDLRNMLEYEKAGTRGGGHPSSLLLKTTNPILGDHVPLLRVQELCTQAQVRDVPTFGLCAIHTNSSSATGLLS